MSEQNLPAQVRAALESGEGILRLAPAWVPRSFLMPGGRLKLRARTFMRAGDAPGWYRRALVCVDDGRRKRRSTAGRGAELCREQRRPIHAEGRDRNVRVRDHRRQAVEYLQAMAGVQQVLRQSRADSAPHAPEPGASGQAGPRGKARSYYFPPQLNWTGNISRTRSWGLSRARRRPTFIAAWSGWNEGDNGILDYSKAYRLKPGTGWLIPPCVLHAPARC